MRTLLPLLALACAPKSPTPSAAPAATEVEPAMPFDPDVRHGTLDNGLRWFVETNAEPRDRVVLRLVVDAGSALEDDDQQGLAHFLEHMAFNGTEHFPGNELITYLEGIGARFGPHLNAHTSFDETVYKLTVPTDDPEVLATAFQVLDDWAGGLALDPDEIEKERGVVIEEWRTRLNAGGRIFEQTAPLLFHEARYADRLPIGTKESLESFEHEALARFYDDWYRPELMSVIVVGDVDPEQAQALIEQHFSDLANPDEPRARERFPIPEHDDTFYLVVTDPEVTRASVSVVAKHDDVEGQTRSDYRDSMIEGLAYRMVNERLSELARQAEAPFLGAGAGSRRLGPTEGADSLGVATTEEGILEGLRAAWTEVERLRRHGFTAGELDRARDKHLRMYDSLDKERDTTPSSAHAEELIRHVLHGETVPGLDAEIAMAREWLPTFTLDEVNAWTSRWMAPGSRVVTAVLPTKEGLVPPTEAELEATMQAVAESTIEPMAEEEALPEQLVAAPTPATIERVDETYAESLGFTGWELSNGIKVWFRDTDFKADEVRWKSWSTGGTGSLPDDAYVPAVTANDILYASGYAELDTNQVRRWLAGTSASASHSLGSDDHGTRGSASPEHLGVALQLLYASVEQPRFTEEGLAYVQRSKREAVRNRLQSPDAVFGDAWTALVWPDVPRFAPWTLETVDQMDLAASKAQWERFFGDHTGANYVFVGALPDDFEALITTWIGGLPTAGEALPEEPLGATPARGELQQQVTAGLEERARVKLAWHTPFPEQDWLSRGRLFAVGGVLSTRLREELREERGGVYGVSARATNWTDPEWAMVTVSFTCDPDRVDELVGAVHEVVDELVAAPVDPHYVAQLQEQNRRGREESLRSNSFWLSGFAGALQRDEDPLALLSWDERNDSLSPEVVHEAAQRWLSGDDRVQVVLLPAATED